MPHADVREAALARPGSPEYEQATAAFNLAAPPRPAAALTTRTIGQVQAAVRTAAQTGLPVRVHTTGHASGAVRPAGGTLLVRTKLTGGVEIDPAGRTACIPAGTTWGEVVRAAAPHGLAAAHGSAEGVGVVGYLLGGGVSFYGRSTGLAVNTIRAIELVTPDGTLVRADAEHEPELFWALRGGGGGFGVVTSVEIALFPVAQVITGACYWPAAHAPALLERWSAWSRHAPREATTSLRIMNLPPVPGVPPQLATGPVVCIDGAVFARQVEDTDVARDMAANLLGPMCEVAEPLLDTWKLTGPAGVLDAHMDPADPVPFIGDHLLLRELDGAGAAAFLGAVGEGANSPLAVATLRQLGGAFAQAHPEGGALSEVDAAYAYMGSGPPFGPVTVQALHDHCATVRQALAPWDTGYTVPSLVEGYERPQRHLDEDRLAAVGRVRARVDPQGVFAGDVVLGAVDPARVGAQ